MIAGADKRQAGLAHPSGQNWLAVELDVENERSTPCPAAAGGLMVTPTPRAVPPRSVRWTKPKRRAGWTGAMLALETDGRSPCLAGEGLTTEDAESVEEDGLRAARAESDLFAL
jgi:hypothetical protein